MQIPGARVQDPERGGFPEPFQEAKNDPDGLHAVFGVQGYNFQFELGRTKAPRLEDGREGIIRGVEKNHPSATTQIKRGFTVGGMNAMTIVVSGMRSNQGRDYLIFNMVDVPVQGIIKFVLAGSGSDRGLLDKINEYILPTFRLMGEEGDDLIFDPRVVNTETGLSYRIPRGATPGKKSEAATIFEGTIPGGAFVRVDRVADAGDTDLSKLLDVWTKGAKAILKPFETKTLSEKGQARLALYDRYGGRPVRAMLAFRPGADQTFRIEVAGSQSPLLQAERMASVMDWIDIPAAEAEVRSWLPKVDQALKDDDESTLKRYARRARDRYYLKASLEVARKIVTSAPEKPQEYALQCLEKGGDADVDFNVVKRAFSSSKFKDRTRMRRAAVDAMGNMVNLKVTNYLIRVARGDKDDMVAKQAAMALGRHKVNRKHILPVAIREWGTALKDRTSRNDKKKLRGSRMGDAYRDAVRMLTGQMELKDPDAARDWMQANSKILKDEELVK